MNEVLVSAFLLAGVAFIFIGCLGVALMPDVLCRAHSLSKSLTLGIVLMLIALWLHLGRDGVGLKIFLAICFQVTTIPLAGHLFAFLAYRKKIWGCAKMAAHDNGRDHGKS